MAQHFILRHLHRLSVLCSNCHLLHVHARWCQTCVNDYLGRVVSVVYLSFFIFSKEVSGYVFTSVCLYVSRLEGLLNKLLLNREIFRRIRRCVILYCCSLVLYQHNTI